MLKEQILPPPRFLNEHAAAEYTNLSVKTLRRYRVKGGGCQYVKCGGRVLYDLNDLTEWHVSQKVTSTKGN